MLNLTPYTIDTFGVNLNRQVVKRNDVWQELSFEKCVQRFLAQNRFVINQFNNLLNENKLCCVNKIIRYSINPVLRNLLRYKITDDCYFTD